MEEFQKLRNLSLTGIGLQVPYNMPGGAAAVDRGKHQSFIVTVNNYTEAEVQMVLDMPCLGMICVKEIGAEGTPHLQIAVHFKNATTGPNSRCSNATCGRRFGRGHAEKMEGTWEDQKVYILQNLKRGIQGPIPLPEDIVRNDGKGPKQGERSDLSAARDDIRNGATDIEMLERHVKVTAQYRGWIDWVRDVYRPKLKDLREDEGHSKRMGHWIWSKEPDMGKSRGLRTEYGAPSIKTMYWKGNNDHWWCGYKRQPIVVMDDPGDWWAARLWTHLKKWVNLHVQYEMPVKHGKAGVDVRFEMMIICSNQSPEDFFQEVRGYDEDVFRSRFYVHHILNRAGMETLYKQLFAKYILAEQEEIDHAVEVVQEQVGFVPIVEDSDDEHWASDLEDMAMESDGEE